MTPLDATRKALLEQLDAAAAPRDETADSSDKTPPALKISMKRVPVVTKARRARLEAAARDPEIKRKHFAVIAAD